MSNYTTSTRHGEMGKNLNVMSQMHKFDEDMDDRLEDMIRDIGESSFMKTHIYDTLCSDKDAPLYKGCISFTRLFALLKLFNMKEKMDGQIKVSWNCLIC